MNLKKNTNIVTVILVVLVILLVSVFYFLTNDNLLVSKTWHTNQEVNISKVQDKFFRNEVQDLEKVQVNGDLKHFKDSTYFQDISLLLYNSSDEIIYSADISISGKWSYLQGYLFFEPSKIDVIDIIDSNNISEKVKDFSKKLVIKKFKQTKYIERLDENTLLMVDINNSTSIWSAVRNI